MDYRRTVTLNIYNIYYPFPLWKDTFEDDINKRLGVEARDLGRQKGEVVLKGLRRTVEEFHFWQAKLIPCLDEQ